MATVKTVTLKTNIKVLHNWTDNRTDLSGFLRGKFAKYDRFNMLYVVQSKNDITNHVYKVGVSAGVGRLKEYTKHHGDPATDNGKCAGVSLLYLAGTVATARSRKTVAGKKDAEIVSGYIYRVPWSRKRETEIKRTLKSEGFKAVRGTEWFKVPTEKASKFKEIIMDLNKVVREEAVLEPRRSARLNPVKTRTSARLKKKPKPKSTTK